MRQVLEDFGLLLAIFVIAFFLGEPAVRFYNQFYPVEYGGVIALGVGVMLSLFFLFGLLFGYLYNGWYQSKLFLLVAVTIMFFVIDGFRRDFNDKYLSLGLIIFGYLLGFIFRKIIDAIRKPKV